MCTDESQLGIFVATNASTRNGKQPPVKVVITSGPSCRNGDRCGAGWARGGAAPPHDKLWRHSVAWPPRCLAQTRCRMLPHNHLQPAGIAWQKASDPGDGPSGELVTRVQVQLQRM